MRTSLTAPPHGAEQHKSTDRRPPQWAPTQLRPARPRVRNRFETGRHRALVRQLGKPCRYTNCRAHLHSLTLEAFFAPTDLIPLRVNPCIDAFKPACPAGSGPDLPREWPLPIPTTCQVLPSLVSFRCSLNNTCTLVRKSSIPAANGLGIQPASTKSSLLPHPGWGGT